MSIILELALLVLIVALVIFLFKCPSAIREVGSVVNVDTKDAAIIISEKIGKAISEISASITSIDDIHLLHKNEMFKCDDGTVFAVSAVVCTSKDGDGFRIEMATNGSATHTKLISNDEHTRLVNLMVSNGCF